MQNTASVLGRALKPRKRAEGSLTEVPRGARLDRQPGSGRFLDHERRERERIEASRLLSIRNEQKKVDSNRPCS